MKIFSKLKANPVTMKFLLIIAIGAISIILISILSNFNEKSINDEIVGNWEVKYGTINGIDYLNYTFNEDKTFKWVIKNTGSDEIVYTGTYKMAAKTKVITKLTNGNSINNTVQLSNGNLLYDDVPLVRVEQFSAKFSKETQPEIASIKSKPVTSSSQTAQEYTCALEGCPNKTTSPGTYCSVHAKGKTNKCISCGASIWSDETYCDNCLFGDFDFTEYGIDY